MPDLDDVILPETFEEIMNQQQEQPQATTSISIPPSRSGKGEKQIQNLTEIAIGSTAVHFRPTAQVRPIQPRIISMKRRLKRQKFLEENAQKIASEDTLITTGVYSIEFCPKETHRKSNPTTPNSKRIG